MRTCPLSINRLISVSLIRIVWNSSLDGDAIFGSEYFFPYLDAERNIELSSLISAINSISEVESASIRSRAGDFLGSKKSDSKNLMLLEHLH